MAFAAYPSHLNFLLMSYPLMETFKSDLRRFGTDKATIRFTTEKPLPIPLLKKLVNARMAEIDTALSQKKPAKPRR